MLLFASKYFYISIFFLMDLSLANPSTSETDFRHYFEYRRIYISVFERPIFNIVHRTYNLVMNLIIRSQTSPNIILHSSIFFFWSPLSLLVRMRLTDRILGCWLGVIAASFVLPMPYWSYTDLSSA